MNLFWESIQRSPQRITWYGVVAHNQYMIAKRKIGTLRHESRACLVNEVKMTKCNWTHVVALCMEVFENKKNHLKLDEHGCLAMNCFSGVEVQPNFRILHPFGCLVCTGLLVVIYWNKNLKVGSSAWVGVYLGNPHCHVESVTLVSSFPEVLKHFFLPTPSN